MSPFLVVLAVILMLVALCFLPSYTAAFASTAALALAVPKQQPREITVVGGGLSGVVAALEIVERDPRAVVYLYDKGSMLGGNSIKAASGISAATSPEDEHVFLKDCMNEGSSLPLAEALVYDSSRAIQWLKHHDVPIPQERVRLGGHSIARTHRIRGMEIMGPLLEYVRNNDRIHVHLNARHSDLGKARPLVVATGGYGQAFAHHHDLPCTNGAHTTGDALLWGLPTTEDVNTNVQIHPTVFMDNTLCPEFIRSRGAVLYDSSGSRFVDELSTRRDVVAAMRATGEKKFNLSIANEKWTREMNAYSKHFVDREGFKVAVVRPAVHFTQGGLVTDDKGRVPGFPGVYAVGEAAGGIHGNNRLGGNSLLACVVFSLRAADHISVSAERSPTSSSSSSPSKSSLVARKRNREECVQIGDRWYYVPPALLSSHSGGSKSIRENLGKNIDDLFGEIGHPSVVQFLVESIV